MKLDTRCELAELVQFHCQLQSHRILCQPVERVFRMCPKRPAVEVTHLVEYDAGGRPFLPACLACVVSDQRCDASSGYESRAIAQLG